MKSVLNYLPILGIILFLIGAIGFLLDTWVRVEHMPLPLLYEGWKYVLASLTGITVLMISSNRQNRLETKRREIR